MTGSLLVLAKAPLHLTGVRHPLARGRPDLHAVHRRLCRLGGIRSLEPQDDHDDRRDRDDIFHIVDPAGAKRRAADHPASADRVWRWFRRLGGVSDRRGIDAGAAPAHLWGHLRDGAGDLVYRGAVYRVPARRQPVGVSLSGIAGRAGDNRGAGADLFRAARKPALALAQRPASGRGRHRQPDHPPVRQSRAAADGRGARRQRAGQTRAASTLLGIVRPRPAALDHGRHSERRLRRHRLFPDFGPAAESAGRSGRGRQPELRSDLAGVLCAASRGRPSPGS